MQTCHKTFRDAGEQYEFRKAGVGRYNQGIVGVILIISSEVDLQGFGKRSGKDIA